MQTAYICSPYRAKTEAELDNHIEYAQELTRKALEAELAPITPHLYITQVTDDRIEEERQRGLAAGLALLDGCNVIVAGKRYGVSAGMRAEIMKAEAAGIKVVTEEELAAAAERRRNYKRGQE